MKSSSASAISKQIARSWLAFVALGVLLAAASPAASDALLKRSFYLPSQPLAEAIAAWAVQSGLQYVWAIEPMTLGRAPEVIGEFTPTEALGRVLEGSRLTYSFVDARTVAIESKSERKRPKSSREGPLRRPLLVGRGNGKNEFVERITVTGTHIRGASPIGPSPRTMDEVEIRQSGYTTTEQILQALPQLARGAGGESADVRMSGAAGASNNITFGTGANVRGLGARATLTLVNGHRVAPSGKGAITDMSLIPLDTIERVEVFADGASALYGADAIAGVVNFILKQDFKGSESHLRYGFTAPSGRAELSGSHTFGTKWERGSLLAIASYLNQSRLSADERSRTSNVTSPETIYPSNEHLALHLAGRHQVEESVTIKADIQQAHVERFAVGSLMPGRLEFPLRIDRTDASAGVHYEGIQGWDIALNGHLSREDTDFSFFYFPPGASTEDIGRSEVQHLRQAQWSTGASATGTVGSLPAGAIRLALGAEHRSESYIRALRKPLAARQDVARSVDSAYLDLRLPLIGTTNRIGGGDVSVSLAGRYDAYSDVGSNFNPKFGVSWMPTSGLEVRGSYSHSFRPPTTGFELMSTARDTDALVSIYSFKSVDGRENVPVAFLTGPRALRPERARHWTAGMTLRPVSMQGWRFDATYYAIAYTKRIVRPPLDANALSNPDLQSFIKRYASAAELQTSLTRETGGRLVYVDKTGPGPKFEGGAFGLNPQDLAQYLFDARLANSAVVHTSGIDIGVHYFKEVGAGEIDLMLEANYIHALKMVLAPGARSMDLVGTTGNPAGPKLRASGAYNGERWSAVLAMNFIDEYTNTYAGVDSRVDPYATVDAQISYTFAKAGGRAVDDVTVSLSITNLFNEPPPYLAGSTATRGANYDTANADALGRLIAIDVVKRW